MGQTSARFGILLTLDASGSSPGGRISRQDIRTALENLKARIRQDGAASPRLGVYLMGHGFGDPALQFFFFAPGDRKLGPQELRQTGAISLLHDTMSNLDLLGALTYLRLNPSMDHFDRFLPSDMMVDPNNPFGSMVVMLDTYGRLQGADQRNQSSGTYPREGNAPVPFLLMMDNCGDGVDRDLVVDASLITPFLVDSFQGLTNEGLAYYAAAPGTQSQTVPFPAKLLAGSDRVTLPEAADPETLRIGSLARRFIEILQLRDAETPLTLVELQREFDHPQDYFDNPGKKPFSHGGTLLEDTRDAQMIPVPPTKPDGVIESRTGTGN